ncbi:MAG: hypothetical protein ACRD38_02780 [Nitrososphaerales archaeon]
MSKLYKYAALAVGASLILSAVAVSLMIPANAAEEAPKPTGSMAKWEYANSDWGVDMTFPPGWTGKAASTSKPKDEFSVTVSNSATDPVATIILEGWQKKLGKPESGGDWLHSRTPIELNCIIMANNPTTYNSYGVAENLNGMSVTKIVQECNLPGVTGVKTTTYSVETKDRVVVLTLSGTSSMPTAQYFWPSYLPGADLNSHDKYLEEFQTSAKMFKPDWAPPAREQPFNLNIYPESD